MTHDILDEVRERIALHRGGGYPTDFYERVVAEITSLRAANAALTAKPGAVDPALASSTSEEDTL